MGILDGLFRKKTKCVVCGSPMSGDEIALRCSRGHDEVLYFDKFGEPSYSTKSEAIAGQCERRGLRVQKERNFWNIYT